MTRSDASTVLFVSTTAGVGGPFRSLATLLSHIEPGIRSLLYSPPSRFSRQDLADVWIPMPSSRRFPRWGRIRAATRFASVAWRYRHETLAIHANGQSELNLAAPAAVIARLPIVLWAHASQESRWLGPFGRFWKVLVPDVRLAAVSAEAAEVLERAGLISGSRPVSIVPNPIDRKEVVADHRIAHEPITVGYLKGKSPTAGWSLLPEVIEALQDQPVRWLLFTSPPTDPMPAQVADAWTRLRPFVGACVEMRGKVADVANAYAECDIVFIPSLQESFGRIAVEAMLNGLPVVASDIPPLRRHVGDDESGLLFPVGDARAAADAIRSLVVDPALRQRLGERGRSGGMEYQPGPIVNQLTAMYRSDGASVSGPKPSAATEGTS
jgi:glycosyltransferase involved in cell wall biosynthesis